MKRFTLEKSIHSCHVTKDLLQQLEGYLTRDVPQLTAVTAEQIKEDFSISITDGLGTVTMKSIADDLKPLFLDSTSVVSLHIAVWRPRMLLSIQLNNRKWFNRVSIDVESETARETASAIHSGIMEIIGTARTSSGLFHPPPEVTGALYMLTFMSLGVGIPLLVTNRLFPGSLTMLAFGALAAYLSLPKVFEYCSFECNRYLRLAKMREFIGWGFISYLVFGIGGSLALTFLQSRLFGP